MTLSPVFRSKAGVRLLAERGVWDRLAGDMGAQAEAVRVVLGDLEHLLGERFRTRPPRVPSASEVTTPRGLAFLQEYFFLVLFRSVFASLGVPEERLRLYTELNFCIKGTITAADNIFDDQSKTLLPLAVTSGPRFLSILQLMVFERLLRRALERAEQRGVVTAAQRDAVQRGLLDRMAVIGALEGSEEGGVAEIPPPDEMVENVHRIRGGALFALAFAAPNVIEEGALAEKMAPAEAAVAQLGTAFQIVDDLTDFEFDVGRRSHNLLTAQIHHLGTGPERAALRPLWGGEAFDDDVVQGVFRQSARAVLERAYEEARASLRGLQALGHWLDPALADDVVHAIVGMDGIARMEALTSSD
jgi:hypothetical protein